MLELLCVGKMCANWNKHGLAGRLRAALWSGSGRWLARGSEEAAMTEWGRVPEALPAKADPQGH